MNAINVVIVSEDIAFSEKLNLLIDSQSTMYCSGISSCVLNDVLFSNSDVVVVDEDIYKSDIECLSKLTSKYPAIKFISLHKEDQFDLMYMSLKFGADMCLDKSKISDFLVLSISHIVTGERVMNAKLAIKILDDIFLFEKNYSYSSILLDKEVKFLKLFSREYSRKQIAANFSYNSDELNEVIKVIFEKLHKYSKKHIFDMQVV